MEMKEYMYDANALLKMDRDRQLEVKETVEEVKALIEAVTLPNCFIEVTEVRNDIKFKTPLPNDTKAKKVQVEIKHLVNIYKITEVVPATYERSSMI